MLWYVKTRSFLNALYVLNIKKTRLDFRDNLKCQSCRSRYVQEYHNKDFNPFILDSAGSKIDKFSKITNWVKLKNKQHRSKGLLNSFPMYGHTLRFCLKNEKFLHPRFPSWSQRVRTFFFRHFYLHHNPFLTFLSLTLWLKPYCDLKDVT